jgi:hypothetical protein
MLRRFVAPSLCMLLLTRSQDIRPLVDSLAATLTTSPRLVLYDTIGALIPRMHIP